MNSKAIETIMGKYNGAGRDSLIPILQEVQEAEGFLSRESVVEIGRRLNLPASKIYGVATFYNQFRFEPKGAYHIQVCRGTACHVKGSAGVLKALKAELGIDVDETTKDGLFSLEVVACVGACSLAPVVCINGEFHSGVTPGKIRQILKSYRKKAANNE